MPNKEILITCRAKKNGDWDAADDTYDVAVSRSTGPKSYIAILRAEEILPLGCRPIYVQILMIIR